MMDKAYIKKVAKKAEKAIRDRPRKATRTLNLTDESFIQFQALCKAQEVSASEVVDLLIKTYVEEFNR